MKNALRVWLAEKFLSLIQRYFLNRKVSQVYYASGYPILMGSGRIVSAQIERLPDGRPCGLIVKWCRNGDPISALRLVALHQLKWVKQVGWLFDES